MTDIALIKAAAESIKGKARLTPLLNSPLLDEVAGRRVYVKAECLQKTGSFKFRGACSAVSALPQNTRYRGVIAFSSGNHAQGVALVARMHGIPAVIVMPADAPKTKIANTRAYGAEVVLYDRKAEDRESLGRRLAGERGLTLIRPFDDPQVIAGQGTIGLELACQLKAEGVHAGDVLVPCGGGGMSSGIALALEQAAPDLRVRTCEPEDYDDVARSLAARTLLGNEGYPPSICDAIVTPRPGEMTFPILQRLCGPGLSVSDEEVCAAMMHAFTHLKIVVEPGGAVALAAALFRKDLIAGDAIAVVASGGNVDPQFFRTVLPV
ncbi:threonine ammonia-lyase [Agrobacterium sp. 22-221-1]